MFRSRKGWLFKNNLLLTLMRLFTIVPNPNSLLFQHDDQNWGSSKFVFVT
ncbi:hypothetical protein Hanom_Chr06g00573111 [Helianthus anomalus]